MKALLKEKHESLLTSFAQVLKILRSLITLFKLSYLIIRVDDHIGKLISIKMAFILSKPEKKSYIYIYIHTKPIELVLKF